MDIFENSHFSTFYAVKVIQNPFLLCSSTGHKWTFLKTAIFNNLCSQIMKITDLLCRAYGNKWTFLKMGVLKIMQRKMNRQ